MKALVKMKRAPKLAEGCFYSNSIFFVFHLLTAFRKNELIFSPLLPLNIFPLYK